MLKISYPSCIFSFDIKNDIKIIILYNKLIEIINNNIIYFSIVKKVSDIVGEN